MATSPEFPVGGRGMEEMLRAGQCADDPTDVEVFPEHRALPAKAPTGMTVEEPALGGTGAGRRKSGGSEVSVMAAISGFPTPAAVAGPPSEPNFVPHFCDGMPRKELRTL